MSFIRKPSAPPFYWKEQVVPEATLMLEGQPGIDPKSGTFNANFSLRSNNNRYRDNVLSPNFLNINIFKIKPEHTEVSRRTPEGNYEINAQFEQIPAAWGKGDLPDGWPSNIYAQGYFLGGLQEAMNDWQSDEAKTNSDAPVSRSAPSEEPEA